MTDEGHQEHKHEHAHTEHVTSHNTPSSKSWFETIKGIAKNKKVQIGLTIVLFLIILYSSTTIRLSNVSILKDQTTGLYTSNDLDSLLFYRQAENILTHNGTLPAVDVLRSPSLPYGWIPEIISGVLVDLYKIEKIFFPNITFDYSATIYAPINFAILLIIFFFLCLTLTNSKFASLTSSALLAFSPVFLFRSIAGFYDHDLLGVFAIVLLILGTILAFKNFNKNWRQTIIWGILIGFLTALVLVSWGGAVTFILVMLPLAGLIYYLNSPGENYKFISFYGLWIIFYSISCSHGSIHGRHAFEIFGLPGNSCSVHSCLYDHRFFDIEIQRKIHLHKTEI